MNQIAFSNKEIQNRYTSHDFEILGVLGGMGPLASTEFLNLIYRFSSDGRPEQFMPKVVMLSDPSIPDRTEAILASNTKVLEQQIISSINKLKLVGADYCVICCITAHTLLNKIRTKIALPIVSLIEVIAKELLLESGRFLLLSTIGTTRSHVIENSEHWASIQSKVTIPCTEDCQLVHETIYKIKHGKHIQDSFSYLNALVHQYKCNGIICGCTEVSLFSNQFCEVTGLMVIDPIAIVARAIATNNYALLNESLVRA